ncbi:MAG: ABC transporter permease, partial [Acidobacteriaceae bacterium]|nr:ABC transporter permease [Acidobacteriaceae bacterium]
PLAEMVVGGFRATLLILMGAVGMLLLIACGNVANMLLARATAREKEIAVRVSMGATRWRLIQQFLTESMLLAVAGALLGCGIAWAGIRILVPNLPPNTIPDEAVIRLNPQVLFFTLAVAVATALIFGLAPAAQSARASLAETLKDTGKGVSGGYRRGRLRSALVVAEVMLSFVLLVGAGLLMRSFFALMQVDLGFNASNILVARIPLPEGQYKTVEQKRQFFRELLARLESKPGIVAATETSTLPPYGGWGTDIDIPGKTHAEKWNALGQLVSEHYNTTLGFRMLRGRFLNAVEVNEARRVTVINQALAKKYFGSDNPIGQHLTFNALKVVPQPPVTDATFEIVGVISDAKNRGLQDPAMPEFFVPYTVTAFAERGILVRTSGDPDRMLNTVRKEIGALDSNVAIALTGSLESYLKKFSYSGPRFGLILLATFAATGLVLAAIGVYSVLAYSVSRQTHEIGVRVALGAANRQIMTMVLRSGFRLIGIGLVLGFCASLVVARLLTTQIWGVTPYDPLTLAAVTVVLGISGLAACLVPAQRAVGVDPTVALRYE